MIRKPWCILAALSVSLLLSGQKITLQTNLLNNADFSAKSAQGMALDWLEDYSKHPNISFQGNVVRFQLGKQAAFLRQSPLILQPGKKYRIGAEIRTENFKAKRSSILIYNTHWAKDVTTAPFPASTRGQWKKWEKVVTLPPSKGNAYSFALYVGKNAAGKLEMRNPFVYPAEQAATLNIKRAFSISRAYLFTPYHPRLFKIPAEKPLMTFSFKYILPLKEDQYSCDLAIRMKGQKSFQKAGSYALKNGFITVSLAKAVPEKEGEMQLSLREKKSGKLLSGVKYPFMVKRRITLSHTKNHKRLNNFVIRLLTGKAKDQRYVFSTPKEGFVHVRLDKFTSGTKIFFNGEKKEILPSRMSDSFEVFKYLPQGDHSLRIEGSRGGNIRINSVAEILVYSYPRLPIPNDPYKKLYGKFTEQYITPVMNIWSYGYHFNVVKKEYFDSIRRGKQWFWQLNQSRNVIPPEMTVKRFLGGTKYTHGRTFDELHFNDTMLNWNFTQALYMLLSCDRRWYPWMSSNNEQTPNLHALNAHFYAGVFNQGRGRGKLLFEGYAETQQTEKEAEIFLDRHLNTNVRQVGKMVKGVAPHWMVILGCYSTPGTYCTNGYAGPDVKKYWDRYFYKLANDPDFRGLAGTGLYAFNNAEEEDLRWACALLRHYVIEGRKDSLAAQYGYKYTPGHLKNGDFEEGSKYWSAKGDVRFTTVKGYGKKGQSRRVGKYTAGDTVALFKRSAKAPNRLVQRMKGFRKGKLYALRFTVADKKDVFAKKPSKAFHTFKATLKGGSPIRKGLPLHEYSSELRISRNGRMNLHTIVFRADSPEITVSFDDWGKSGKNPGKIGQELLLNFIKVTPYYLP